MAWITSLSDLALASLGCVYSERGSRVSVPRNASVSEKRKIGARGEAEMVRKSGRGLIAAGVVRFTFWSEEEEDIRYGALM